MAGWIRSRGSRGPSPCRGARPPRLPLQLLRDAGVSAAARALQQESAIPAAARPPQPPPLPPCLPPRTAAPDKTTQGGGASSCGHHAKRARAEGVPRACRGGRPLAAGRGSPGGTTWRQINMSSPRRNCAPPCTIRGTAARSRRAAAPPILQVEIQGWGQVEYKGLCLLPAGWVGRVGRKSSAAKPRVNNTERTHTPQYCTGVTRQHCKKIKYSRKIGEGLVRGGNSITGAVAIERQRRRQQRQIGDRE